MLNFTPLDKEVGFLKKYFEKSAISFCDISLGVRFMWREDFRIEYAVYNDTLIMRETSCDYKNAFYYPMGEDVTGALNQIEEYCIKNNQPLIFCCIDNKTVALLSERYYHLTVHNDRGWSDYIYDAEKFKTFSGKKYGGQRNHVNKFKKTYPNYKVKKITKQDLENIKEFMWRYEAENDFSVWTAREEQRKIEEFLDNMFELGQQGCFIEVDGKVVALSIGERINDCLIVHIEKGLKEYQGVYPTMANEFAKAFANDGIKYINREEDCGDMGLRISKLQYQPIEVKEKNVVSVRTLFDKIVSPIKLTTERLTVSDILKEDAEDYYRLYMDDELNKYWGYDYREDLKGENPSPKYFYDFMTGLKEKKEEYSLAVRKEGKMIGELVLHNFDFEGGVEIGYRIFKEHQRKGYAKESAKALISYAFDFLKAKTVKTRCCKPNVASRSLIKSLGFINSREDENCYYFNMTLQNKKD